VLTGGLLLFLGIPTKALRKHLCDVRHTLLHLGRDLLLRGRGRGRGTGTGRGRVRGRVRVRG